MTKSSYQIGDRVSYKYGNKPTKGTVIAHNKKQQTIPVRWEDGDETCATTSTFILTIEN